MKKFFFFAVALATSMAINAKVYEMGGLTPDDITIVENGELGTYTMDDADIPSVSYNGTESANMTVNLSNGIKLQYKNSSAKSNILKFAEKYTQTDGKNVVVLIEGLNIGDQVIFYCTAKGSTAPIVQAVSGAAETDPVDVTTESNAALEDYQQIKFTAIASTMEVKETNGGYRIAKIVVGTETAVENVNVAGQAIKVVENGQVYIIKNGVKYNVLGAIAE